MKKYLVVLMALVVLISGCGVEQGLENEQSLQFREQQVENLLEHKGSYIGDASNVVNILRLLQIRYDSVILDTDAEPYVIEIEKVKVQHEDEFLEISQEEQAYRVAMIFALVKNVSIVTFIGDDDTETYTREEIEEKYGVDLRELKDNKEELIEVLGI